MRWMLVAATVLLVACSEAKTEPTVEQKLASLDGVSKDQAPQYGRLLDSLDAKCVEDRTKIADQATLARKMLKDEKHVNLTTREILEDMDKAVPASPGTASCAETAAALVTLTKPK